MDKTTIGIFNSKDGAETAISEARSLGISDVDISYIYNSDGQMVVADGSGETHAGEGAAAGATTGALLGGVAGLAVAAGILPGLGALFIAGPLAGALGLTGTAATTVAGALTGAAAGGLVGALAGLGVKDEEAKVYEERVRLGGILIAIKSESDRDIEDIFKRNGAEEVRVYAI